MTVGLLGIPSALGTELLIILLSIAVSAAMMRPIMPTSTTSRNSNCSCREPIQYFCICFRASLSIHRVGWIFPFSTFITSCFSGHNTLFFLAVSGFVVYTTQFGHLKPRRNPLLVLNKRPHCGRLWLRGGRYDPRAFSCLSFRPPKSRKKLPKTASKTLAGAGPPPSPKEAHTAAYKGIHGASRLAFGGARNWRNSIGFFAGPTGGASAN